MIIINLFIIFNNQEKIERVDSTKFLGFIINSKVIWSDHIETIIIKISKSLGIICRIRNKHPISTVIKPIYYSYSPLPYLLL